MNDPWTSEIRIQYAGDDHATGYRFNGGDLSRQSWLNMRWCWPIPGHRPPSAIIRRIYHHVFWTVWTYYSRKCVVCRPASSACISHSQHFCMYSNHASMHGKHTSLHLHHASMNSQHAAAILSILAFNLTMPACILTISVCILSMPVCIPSMQQISQLICIM